MSTPTGICVDSAYPDAWFSEDQEDIAYAKSICRRCPIKVTCFEGARERLEQNGVWGGQNFAKRHPSVNAETKRIRDWATGQGITVSSVGTLPKGLRERYAAEVGK